ncbi:MAG: hypothetical protein CMP91_13175 [Gammaproteobacteria bacterium]|nr:hypothetical protein [Gammaproteobacteria bacterium]|tara:strand:- start:10002 stop:11336 length:1335 start_codon:yes stop_codon:yes gene_type:complete
MSRIYFSLIAFTLFFSAPALSQSDITLSAGRVIQQAKHSDGVWNLVQFQATDRTTGARFTVNRSVKIPKASLGTLAKGRMFSPLGLGFTAAMLAYDYYVDSEDEEVYPYDPALLEQTMPVGAVNLRLNAGYGWSCPGYGTGSNIPFPSVGHALQFIIDQCSASNIFEEPEHIFNPDAQCGPTGSSDYNNVQSWWGGTSNYCGNPARMMTMGMQTGESTIPIPITENNYNTWVTEINGPDALTAEEISDAIMDHPNWDKLTEALLYDEELGQLDRNIAQISSMISDLINDLENYINDDPADPPIDENDTDVDSIQDGDATDVQQPPRETAQELADTVEATNEQLEAEANPNADGQCDLYPDTLGCLDVGDDFTETELDNYDVPFDMTPVTLASGGACPSDVDFDLNIGNYSFSYQPTCNALEDFKPVVLLVFSFLSLLVVSTVRV